MVARFEFIRGADYLLAWSQSENVAIQRERRRKRKSFYQLLRIRKDYGAYSFKGDNNRMGEAAVNG